MAQILLDIDLIIDSRHKWHKKKFHDTSIFIKGTLWIGKSFYTQDQACDKLYEMFVAQNGRKPQTQNVFKEKVKTLNGHFAFMIDAGEFLMACVDKVRSIPLFYVKDQLKIIFSNSAIHLRHKYKIGQLDEKSLLEFSMAGYVGKKKTLYKDLFQIQSGEFILVDKKNSSLYADTYFKYLPQKSEQLSESQWLERIDQAHMLTFKNVVEQLNGRPVWIPLSGGLDSRLILATLLSMNYDRVFTFTYGMPQVWEIKRARQIAEMTKVKWFYIPYRPETIKKLYRSSIRRKYFAYASGLSSIPALTDFYAVWAMTDQGLIDRDSVIINGQSGDFTSGGHIPDIFMAPSPHLLNASILIDELIKKHYSLWRHLKTDANIDYIQNQILSQLQIRADEMMTGDQLANIYEFYECKERQCKYVINGQRMYEWFGYDWQLPLWSDELVMLWKEVPPHLKFKQQIFKTYLARKNPAGLFNCDFSPQYAYVPKLLRAMHILFKLFNTAFKKYDDLYFHRTYMLYFLTYAPFYPQKNFFEYLKDSTYHRNAISYYANGFVEDIKANHI